MKILVSTDTSCLVNYEALKKHEISVFPLNVIVDGEEYLDGITINQDQLKDAMRAKKKIKTSTPPLGEVVEYFESLFKRGYDHIIHFTISSKLSSMNQLFNNVANQNFPGKITVIDSYGLTTTMLSQVFYAYEEANKGLAIEEIVKGVEERKSSDYIAFIPENLDALKNGGRISPTIATIGNVLGIKPLINLSDGELKKDTMIRNVKKTIADKLDKALETMPVKDYDYTIVSFDANQAALQYIYDYADNKLGKDKIIKGIIPINVCAHCGPGTIGLIISKKINGKSLKEFI